VARDLLDSLIEAEVIVASPLAHDGAMWRAYGWDEARYLQNGRRIRPSWTTVSSATLFVERLSKSYASAADEPRPLPAPSGAIQLPLSKLGYDGDLFGLLRERRTTRVFSGEIAHLEVLSAMLARALAEPRMARFDLDEGPTADPLKLLRSRFVAFDLFVVSQRVNGLDPGIYEYFRLEHALEGRAVYGSSAQADADLEMLVWGQTMPQRAAFSILVTIDFARYMWRYRYPRAFRNLLISLANWASFCCCAARRWV